MYSKIFLASILFLTSSLVHADACRYNANNEVQNLVTDADSSCNAPALYNIKTYYKIAFCKEQPSAPTSSAASDFNSKCVVLVDNEDGTPIEVSKGNVVKFPGISSSALELSEKSEKGVTYSYLYVESKPDESIRAKVNFETARTAVDGTSGKVCWTNNQSIYTYGPMPIASASCGSSAPADIGAVKVISNSYSVSGPLMSYDNHYLVDSAGKLAANTTSGAIGTVSKEVGIIPFSVTITPKSNSLRVAYDMSQGTWIVNNMSGGTQKTWFQPGQNNASISSCHSSNCKE